LTEFDRLMDRGDLEERIITLREALQNLPEIEIHGDLGNRIRKGHQVFSRDLDGLRMPPLERNQRVKILHGGEILAIAKAQGSNRDGRGYDPEVPVLSLLRVFA
jgi:hypothetical protein